MNWPEMLLKMALSVAVGGLIGTERERHGRAAGMRTHALVCLGAALTSMTSLFVSDVLGNNGDVFRISAQVISGVGFLGAGMIILRKNHTITGLTTAAGIWTTGAIGIAIGYGFYIGAVGAVLLFLTVTTLFARFEKRKKAEAIYVEIDNMYRTNAIIRELQEMICEKSTVQTIAPRSETPGHLGLVVVIDRRLELNLDDICKIENVIYAVEGDG